jgi:predicted outer membrane repeat protein
MIKKIFITLFITLAACKIYAQEIIYVKPNSNNNNNGKNWVQAYTSINDALSNSQVGSQIWVAKGIYLPTNSNDRDIAYEIKKGIKLYGGFEGSETSLSQRNITQNKTILSGDIGMKDDSTDNSYNIIRCNGCDSTNLIDGFYFKNGNADNQEPLVDTYSNKKCGSAIYVNGNLIDNTLPTINNCKFQNNSAFQYGGAIFFHNKKNIEVKNSIKNCSFIQNNSRSGGGIYIYNISKQISKNVIDSCYFESNTAVIGGGIYFYTENKNIFYSINNSMFKENSSKLEGGAIYFENYLSDKCDININNSQFEANFSHNGSSISCFSFNSLNNYIFNKLIFTKHNSGSIVYLYQNSKDIVNMQNCIFKNNIVRNSIFGASAKIINSFFENNIDSLAILTIENKHVTSVYNSIFSKNSTIFNCIGDSKQSSTIEVHNCLFDSNSQILKSEGFAPLIDPNKKNYVFGIGNFYNCIFQNNNKVDKEVFSGQSEIKLLNCGIDTDSINSYLKKNNQGGKITILGISNITDIFLDSNLLLLPCSPAINAGNNTYAQGNLTDFDDKPRIAHQKIDIGPYEYQDFKVSNFSTKPSFCTSKEGSFLPILQGNCTNLPMITWKNTQNQTGNGSDKLAAGTYTFFIKDTNDCADTLKNILIEDKGNISADFNIFNTSGTNAKNGSITVTNVSNGKAPFKYFWSNGDTTKSIKNLAAGDYKITISDANGCLFSTTLSVKAASATTDIFIKNISATPNPISDKITFHCDTAHFSNDLFVTFYDIQGKIILPKQRLNANEQIDVSYFVSGLYFYQITDNQHLITKKIIILH